MRKINFINIGKTPTINGVVVMTPEWKVRGFTSAREFKLAAGECLHCQSPAISGKRHCAKHAANNARLQKECLDRDGRRQTRYAKRMAKYWQDKYNALAKEA